MKNKIGWIIIVIQLGLIGWLMTKYRKEINNFSDSFITPTVNKTETQLERIVSDKKVEVEEEITIIDPTPTLEIKKVTPTVIKKIIYPTPVEDDTPWGVAQQVDEVTWTMRVGDDEKMATPEEILIALNDYRQQYGSQLLTWDSKLAEFAQKRAKDINTNKTTDKHEGFKNFLENDEGFDKLGFNSLGENIAWGYKLNGVHTIEWMYGGDEAHNSNQLSNKWNYVGIGVEGLASCLIFGTGKF